MQFSPLFPLTYIKQFYGRRRQKKAPESARRSEPRPAPWCSKWLRAKALRAALDAASAAAAAVDFLSHLSHLSCPEQHLPQLLQDPKGHQGQMLSPFHTGTFTVNDLLAKIELNVDISM